MGTGTTGWLAFFMALLALGLTGLTWHKVSKIDVSAASLLSAKVGRVAPEPIPPKSAFPSENLGSTPQRTRTDTTPVANSAFEPTLTYSQDNVTFRGYEEVINIGSNIDIDSQSYNEGDHEVVDLGNRIDADL